MYFLNSCLAKTTTTNKQNEKKKEEELGQKSELEKIDAQPTGKTISGIEGDLRWETFGHFDVSLEIFFPKVVRLKCGEFRQQLLRA